MYLYKARRCIYIYIQTPEKTRLQVVHGVTCWASIQHAILHYTQPHHRGALPSIGSTPSMHMPRMMCDRHRHLHLHLHRYYYFPGHSVDNAIPLLVESSKEPIG